MVEQSFKYFPFLTVEGSNYEIGFKVGQNFRNQINNVLQKSIRIQNLEKYDHRNPQKVKTAEKLIKNHFPQYLEEIHGISDGSGIDYQKILLINLFHLFEHENCSTVIFKTKKVVQNGVQKEILLVHNEDHNKVMCENSYYLQMKLSEDLTIFCHTYPGCIPGYSHGMNSNGIVITCNYVPDPIGAVGIPRTVLGRWMLESKSIEQAVERAHGFSPRTGGVSYNIASLKEYRAVNVEITGNDFAVTEIEDRFFHPNHYIAPKFADISVPDSSVSTTKRRWDRSKILLPNTEKSLDGALNILWDDQIFITPTQIPNKGTHLTYNTIFFQVNSKISTRIYTNRREKREYDEFCLDLG
ncbi:C45 family autoproteolytic acyltransferase/hydolase [Candidatus Harpocratesius sp.]